MVVGVISDTHGLLRPQALEQLRGVQHIVHAGDIGDPAILEQLSRQAPVTAVRGNTDRGEWARRLPLTEVLEVGGVCLYVLHSLEDLDLDPVAAGFAAVIHGHTHRPSRERRQEVLFLNPGSAGPRRFTLPVTLARLTVSGRKVDAEVIQLKESS